MGEASRRCGDFRCAWTDLPISVRRVRVVSAGAAPPRLSPTVQDRASTRQLWPPTSSRLSRGTCKCATALAVSVGRRRSTRVCGACALCRAGCGRFMSYGRALHQREAPLPRCKTVLRRAGCGLQRAASRHLAHASAPLHWLSVGRRCSTRVCGARAPCRAGCGRSMPYGRVLH